MIANVSAHRRANAFAQALEELSDRDSAAEQPEGPAPDPDPEQAPPAAERADQRADHRAERTEPSHLLALTTGLGELPKPVLDPAVKVVHRAQLVAAMEAMLRTARYREAGRRTLWCPSSAPGPEARTGRAGWGSCDPVHG